MKILTKILLIAIMSVALYTINGCINVDQKTVINEDLSGTIDLHYWMMSLGDMKMGDEVAGYTFIVKDARDKFTSENSQVTDIKRYDNKPDTTIHMEIKINFKDINKLTDAPGFAKHTISYVKGADGMDFKYVVPQDTAMKKHYIKESQKLEYTFTFPKKVISSNGTIVDSENENVVKWSFPAMDLANGDIVMTAVVKDKSGICGLFGIELPLILISGMVLLHFRRKR